MAGPGCRRNGCLVQAPQPKGVDLGRASGGALTGPSARRPAGRGLTGPSDGDRPGLRRSPAPRRVPHWFAPRRLASPWRSAASGPLVSRPPGPPTPRAPLLPASLCAALRPQPRASSSLRPPPAPGAAPRCAGSGEQVDAVSAKPHLLPPRERAEARDPGGPGARGARLLGAELERGAPVGRWTASSGQFLLKATRRQTHLMALAELSGLYREVWGKVVALQPGPGAGDAGQW